PLSRTYVSVIYSEQIGARDQAYDLVKRAKDATNEPHINDTLGWILCKRGEYSNALPLLQESADKVPGSPAIHFHLGMVHYMLGEEAAARLALQKAADALKDFPQKQEAQRRLAVLAIPVGTANSDVRTE